jgi:hypothetical protein
MANLELEFRYETVKRKVLGRIVSRILQKIA